MDPEKRGDRHGRKRGKRGVKKRGWGLPFEETAKVSTPPTFGLMTPDVSLQAAALEMETASQPSLSPAAAIARPTECPVDAGASALGIPSLGRAHMDEPMTEAGVAERLLELQLSDEEEEELMAVLPQDIRIKEQADRFERARDDARYAALRNEQAARMDRLERARDEHYAALRAVDQYTEIQDIRIKERLGAAYAVPAAAADRGTSVVQMDVGPGAPVSAAAAGEPLASVRPARQMEFFGDSMNMRPLFFTGDIVLPAGSFLGIVTPVPSRVGSELDLKEDPEGICTGTTLVLQLDHPLAIAARIGAVPARSRDVATAAALGGAHLPSFLVESQGETAPSTEPTQREGTKRATRAQRQAAARRE